MDQSNNHLSPPPNQTSHFERNSKVVPSSYSRHHSGPASESRTQYIPYEKTIIQYEPVTRVEYVPRERKVIQYYPVEYQTEYIPQVYHEKVIDYVPVERLQERVEYIPVEREIHYPPQEEFYEDSLAYQPPSNRYAHTTTSRIQPPPPPATYMPANPSSMSFRDSGVYPPQNNSFYTKQPLPSSKRHYI